VSATDSLAELTGSHELVLAAQDLTVAYGDLEVVHGASLTVAPGEVVALLGPNGAGKTTLLLALAGFLKPTGGQVQLFGAPAVPQAHLRARQGVAFIGDDRNLFRSLTVRQSLRMVRRQPAQLTEMFPELGAKMKAKGSLLSGGQQQMLALGRALVADPKILIIDELSLGLAPIVRNRLLTYLRSIADTGAAVLVVEQSARTVLEVADRAYVMGRGELVAEGPASEWLANFDELSDLFLR
jgi:branched-chain amino acid transport system ATP-binding protein